MTSVRVCGTALTSLSGNLRGDALRDLARCPVVEKDGELGLTQQVDESRRDDQAGCDEPASRAAVLESPQVRDPVTTHTDIGAKRRRTGPIDDATTKEEHVAIGCCCAGGFRSGSRAAERECQPAQNADDSPTMLVHS